MPLGSGKQCGKEKWHEKEEPKASRGQGLCLPRTPTSLQKSLKTSHEAKEQKTVNFTIDSGDAHKKLPGNTQDWTQHKEGRPTFCK